MPRTLARLAPENPKTHQSVMEETSGVAFGEWTVLFRPQAALMAR
jgi:hypothetical protein